MTGVDHEGSYSSKYNGIIFRYHKTAWIQPFQNNRIWEVTELKAFADDKFDIAKLMISHLDGGRKHCGKRRKCCLPASCPFPTVFSKAFCVRL